MTLFLLFVFSYKKQAAYIKSRVENICGNEEDEISRLKKENESLRTDLEKESRKNSPYPLISVIIPCYNAKRFVERAVRSIMEQSYRNLEILCCDDCSTDGTLSILRRLSAEDSRIKILQNETNLGVIDTLNKLVREASGVYIARMDADDISLPDRLAKQLAFMQQNPQVDFCGCNAFHINETGKTIGKTTLPESYDDIKFFLPYYSTFYHPTIFARADILKDNPYDKDFLHAEDYELWCRLIFEKGMRGENLQERLLKYRINSQGVSRQNMEMQMENSAKIFDKYEIVSNKEFHKNVLFLHCALVATNETDILKDFKKIFRSKKIKFANPAYEKLLLHLKKFKQKKLFVKMLFCTLGIYSVCTILFRKIRGK